MSSRARGLWAALVGLLFALPLRDRGVSVGDEGHLLAIAARLARGDGVLYRDIATNIPPLCYETLALAFRLLGETLQTERLLGVALVAMAARASYLLGEALGGRLGGAAGLAAFLGCKGLALPHWNVFYYTEASLALALSALAILVGVPLRARGVAAAGILVALSAGFKQSYGAFVLLAAVAAVARRPSPRGRSRDLAILLLPSVVLGAALVARFAAASALGDFLRWNVIYFLGTFSRDLGIPYPRLLPGEGLWPGREASVALFYYLPSCVFSEPSLWSFANAHAAAAGALVRIAYLLPLGALLILRRGLEPAPLFALLSLSALWPLSDFSHYLDAMLPLAVIGLPMAAGRAGEGDAWIRRTAVAAAALLLAAGTLAQVRAWQRLDTKVSLGDAGYVLLGPAEARALAGSLAELRRHVAPGAPILALPYAPFYYFAGPYRNPTPLYLPFPSFLAAEEERIVRDAGRATGVIVGGGQWPHLPPLAKAAPRLDKLLRERFVRTGAAGGMVVLVPRDAKARRVD